MVIRQGGDGVTNGDGQRKEAIGRHGRLEIVRGVELAEGSLDRDLRR
jgi:hypothetical protein